MKAAIEAGCGISGLARRRIRRDFGNEVRDLRPDLCDLTGMRYVDFFFFGLYTEVNNGGLGEIEDLGSLTGSCCIDNIHNAHDVKGLKKANINGKNHIWGLSINWYYRNMPKHSFDVYIFITKPLVFEKQTFELVEAKLEALQPHRNLKELEIDGYPGIQFPWWVGDPAWSKLRDITLEGCNEWDGSGRVLDRHLPCLQSISIIDCAKIKDIKIVQSSSLRRQLVKQCPEITTLHGLCSLNRLEKLEITKCYKFVISAEERLPSKLQFIQFQHCWKLTSITGLQDLCSLEELKLQMCPKLRLSLEEQLSTMPSVLEIADCPGLEEWCQRYGFKIIQESPNDLFVRSDEQIKLWLEEAYAFFENICVLNYNGAILRIEKWPVLRILGFYICSSIHLKCIKWNENFNRLKQLRVWDCSHLEELTGLHNIITLQDMDISNCPNLVFIFGYPKNVQYLAIDRCYKLENFDSWGYNISSLEISSCSTLKILTGLKSQASLHFLKISNCPQLCLDDELLPDMLNPNNVEISACPQLQEWCKNQDVAYI